ncbi:hypothetical protein KC19_VG122000 [Ceratodon purpureus]|uniref:Uncharacterized protein n=1 Tax=Ceratodon purpureus TaxID=3225 RepID=A0A8T0HQA2_CERPU|nr:hypothetical protein KC19_VG122000 [Ceratodon purpureus]
MSRAVPTQGSPFVGDTASPTDADAVVVGQPPSTLRSNSESDSASEHDSDESCYEPECPLHGGDWEFTWFVSICSLHFIRIRLGRHFQIHYEDYSCNESITPCWSKCLIHIVRVIPDFSHSARPPLC